MNISKINPIINEEYLKFNIEGLYLERKSIHDSKLKPSKLANEIIGMLNADGGVIVLGLGDGGEVEDLSKTSDEFLLKYEKVCQSFISPPANINLEKAFLSSGELIYLFHIESDYENMYERKDNHNVFRRIGDSNYGPLDNVEIDKLRHDKSLRKFEDQVIDEFDTSDLDVDILNKYKEKLEYEGGLEELLEKRNLVKKKDGRILYKNSAILLFSKNPSKYIPSSYVRYVRYDGNKADVGEYFNVLKDKIFDEGGIISLIDQVRKFISASLKDFYFLNMANGKFESISEYPEEAWLEGLVNALYHRSYYLQGNCIYIKHFDDRLEISNSGPLPAQVNVDNIREQRFSRNPRIGRVLYDMGYVRELNEGVNRIFSSMERSMLSDPIYTDKNDTVVLTLINKIAKNKQIVSEKVKNKITENWSSFNQTEQSILQCIMKETDPIVSDISRYSEVSEKSVRHYLKKFIEQGIIVRKSEKERDKNAKYTFRDKNQKLREGDI